LGIEIVDRAIIRGSLNRAIITRTARPGIGLPVIYKRLSKKHVIKPQNGVRFYPRAWARGKINSKSRAPKRRFILL